MLLRRTAKYAWQAFKLGLRQPRGFHPLWLTRDFAPWLGSLDAGTPLDDGRPWLTFPAARLLERLVGRRSRVFEWGAGGSTLFFAARGTRLVTIEHDDQWLERVRGLLESRALASEWQPRLCPPEPGETESDADPANWDHYASADAALRGASFRRYASAIDAFPEASFDLVVIDGRARPSCFKHAIPRIKPGGYILWDDTERGYYRSAMDSAPPEFRRVDLPGPLPYVERFTTTTAWHVSPHR